jgi:hypothetical protein
MKQRIISPANYINVYSEHSTKPSLTVPDMSIPLKTLLEKYTRGAELPQKYQPIYDEDNTYPDPRTLDLVDIQEYKMALDDQVLEFKRQQSVNNSKTLKDAQRKENTIAENQTSNTTEGKEPEKNTVEN